MSQLCLRGPYLRTLCFLWQGCHGTI